jgi:hypothetical protein
MRRPRPDLGSCTTKRTYKCLLLHLKYLQHCQMEPATHHVVPLVWNCKDPVLLYATQSTSVSPPKDAGFLSLIVAVKSTGICGLVCCLHTAWEILTAYVSFQEFRCSWHCHIDSSARREPQTQLCGRLQNIMSITFCSMLCFRCTCQL